MQAQELFFRLFFCQKLCPSLYVATNSHKCYPDCQAGLLQILFSSSDPCQDLVVGGEGSHFISVFGSSCTEGGLEFLLDSGGVLNIPPDYFIMGHTKASHDALIMIRMLPVN